MIDINSFIKQMLSQAGLSAYEDPICKLITDTWRPMVDELSFSKLGSLHALKKGMGADPRPSLMIAAHMDAIGIMVKGITETGFLRLTSIGGLDARVLPGQLVTVHGRQDIPGVICQPPVRLLPEEYHDKPVPMKYLFVDTGMSGDEVKKWVRTGDIISFAQDPIDMSGDFMGGHSVDNRASVAALTVCLEELQHIMHCWDIWAVATVQEEVTMAGGKTSPFDIQPDIAIAVDVTFAKGPGSQDYRTFPIDKGPTLGWGPNIHPAVHNEMKELAAKLDIPHQIEVMAGRSGTDADAMQIVGQGIPSMVLSIPIRYMHTPVEVLSTRDVQRAGHLLAEFIAHLNMDFIKNITWDD